jgi:hypothetical protein
MEYYRLYDLRNQYPSISNYGTTIPGTINLRGLYPETNTLAITIKNLEGIKFVKDTRFRFILKIKEKQTDTTGVLYTSERYYNNLESSLKESNPYFINSSLNDVYIVEIFTESLNSLFTTFLNPENRAGVSINRNNFINKNKSIDYDLLVKYIDWVVSQATLSDIDSNGVIPPEKLIDFVTFEIDHEKAYFYPDDIQRPTDSNTSGGSTGTGDGADATNRNLEAIKALEEELEKINSDISTYTGFINQDDYPNDGLSKSKLLVKGKLEEIEYVSSKYLLNRKKQNEDIRKQLTAYSDILKLKKDSLQTQIELLK